MQKVSCEGGIPDGRFPWHVGGTVFYHRPYSLRPNREPGFFQQIKMKLGFTMIADPSEPDCDREGLLSLNTMSKNEAKQNKQTKSEKDGVSGRLWNSKSTSGFLSSPIYH